MNGLLSVSQAPVLSIVNHVLVTEVLLSGGVILKPLCSILVYLKGAKKLFDGCCNRRGSEATIQRFSIVDCQF